MAMIKCPECGTEISDKAAFCPKCGMPAKQTQEDNNSSIAQSVSKSSLPPKNRKSGLIIILVSLLVICIFIITRTIITYNNSTGAGSVSIFPQERTTNIISGNIIVESSQWYYYQFSTNNSWSNIYIKGSFHASGGSGNDIRVLIMTENDFTNYKNGHKSRSYYNSGQMTVSNLDIKLPSETQNYVLVFDNTFSLVSNKNITANIDLIYTY